MSDFTDLLAPGGANMAGISNKIYFIPVDDIATEAHIADNPATMSDEAVIVGSHDLKSGKKWYELYLTQETGEVKDAVVGEIDGKSFEISLEIFHPGTRAEALGFAAKILNGSFIFLVPESCGGGARIRQVGSVCFPAKLDAGDGTTGKANADRKGFTFTWKSKGSTPAPIYQGSIDLYSGSGS